MINLSLPSAGFWLKFSIDNTTAHSLSQSTFKRETSGELTTEAENGALGLSKVRRKWHTVLPSSNMNYAYSVRCFQMAELSFWHKTVDCAFSIRVTFEVRSADRPL